MAKSKKKHPEKKIAIFEAAIDLIAENGFHASPTAKIAEKANIGTGTIYRYFQSKDQLINEIFQYIEEEMNAVIIKDHNPNSPVREQFIELCDKFIRFSFDNPKASNFFNQYIDSPYGTTLRRDEHARDGDNIPKHTLLYPFYVLFNEAREKGLIKNLPNALSFTLIYGSISNFIRDVMIGLIDYSEEIENQVIAACWDTIKSE